MRGENRSGREASRQHDIQEAVHKSVSRAEGKHVPLKKVGRLHSREHCCSPSQALQSISASMFEMLRRR